MQYQRGSLQRHEEIKQTILSSPELIGIHKEDIISIETEYPLTRRRKTVFARPDIAISYQSERGIRKRFVEIKSGSCRRAKYNLAHQLKKIENYIRISNMPAEVVGVYPANTLGIVVILAN